MDGALKTRALNIYMWKLDCCLSLPQIELSDYAPEWSCSSHI